MATREEQRKAAEQGRFSEMQYLAINCLYGINGPEDPIEARHWFERSLETGDTSRAVETALGRMLIEGLGGPPDVLRGMGLLRCHASQDFAVAVVMARAARQLATEAYAHVAVLSDGAAIADQLALETDSEEIEALREDEEVAREATAFLTAYPETLPNRCRAPLFVPPGAAALLSYLETLADRRRLDDEFSEPELTRHWVRRIRRVASLHLGLAAPPTLNFATQSPAGGALDAWFEQREKEAVDGAAAEFLPVPAIAPFQRFKLDRLRTLSVLLEPREPIDDRALWSDSAPADHVVVRNPSIDGIRSVASEYAAGSTRMSPMTVLLLLEGASQLPPEDVAVVLPILTPLVEVEHARALELALGVGDEAAVSVLLAARLPLTSREDVVDILLRHGRRDEAEEVGAEEVGASDGPLLRRTIESEMIRVALGGARSADVVEQCLNGADPSALGTVRRLALLAVRVHPEPLKALTMLAEQVVPVPDDSPFHTMGSWSLIARIDSIAAAVVELSNRIRMDGPR